MYLLKTDIQGVIWKPEIMRISKLSKIIEFEEGIPEKTMVLLRATSFSDTLDIHTHGQPRFQAAFWRAKISFMKQRFIYLNFN